MTFSATRAPASRHTLAVATSSGLARRRRTPHVEHAALWSPSASRRRRQEHVLADRGRGRCKRRNVSTRNSAEERVVAAEVGKTVKTLPAHGPLCERSSALNARLRQGRARSWFLVCSSRAPAAQNCHPWAHSPSSAPLGYCGRAPRATRSQEGQSSNPSRTTTSRATLASARHVASGSWSGGNSKACTRYAAIPG